MSCEKTDRLRNLAVEEPGVLEEPVWGEHFADCPPCREEWKVFSDSLVIFKQLEGERISLCPPALAWEKFSAVLAQEKKRRISVQFFLKFPMAAAIAGLVLAGSLAGWMAWSPPASEAGVTAGVVHPEREVIARGMNQGNAGFLQQTVNGLPGSPLISNGQIRQVRRGGNGRTGFGVYEQVTLDGLPDGSGRTMELQGGRQELQWEQDRPVPVPTTPVSNQQFSVNFSLK